MTLNKKFKTLKRRISKTLQKLLIWV